MAIVNETFANRNFPGRSAIGAQFKFGNTGEKGHWYRIVGVVREIHEVGMEEAARPVVYGMHEQGSNQLMIPPGGIAVRTAVEPASIVSAIRQALWSIDKNQPVWPVQTLEDKFDRQLTAPTQSTALMGAFALLALLLASVGCSAWMCEIRSHPCPLGSSIGVWRAIQRKAVQGLKLMNDRHEIWFSAEGPP